MLSFSQRRRRVPNGFKHGDILRGLRNLQSLLPTTLSYNHVKSHQDKQKTWEELSLPSQCNCLCDGLAKEAANRGAFEGRSGVQLLPMESSAVVIGNEKLCSDISKDVRFYIGKAEARKFYIENHILTGAAFDSVDWEGLDSVVSHRPKMFQIWLAKQASGFCGTRKMVARMNGHDGQDDSCPNCDEEGEDASHLNVCSDDGRSTLFFEMVDCLEDWMHSTSTDPDLAYWIPRYLRSRNTRSFCNLGILPPHLSALARSQNEIGWLHFLEGKVSTEIRRLQSLHLLQSNTNVTISSWMRQFIAQLLDISHSQWIYRNIAVHHHTRGILRLAKRKEILAEIERQLQLPVSQIPETSRFLLEISPVELERSHPTEQSYWLLAIQAARKAGRRVVTKLRRRRTARSIAAAAEKAVKRRKLSPRQPSDELEVDAPLIHKHPLLGADAYDPLYKRRKPD